jgi:GPH family glycoside/pentoside/hexuronide:cation symporter
MQPGQYWQAAAAFSLIGFALASWYIIPTSLIADTVDYGKMRGGEDSAGFYMALFNFVDKAALAVAALIALPLLDWLGFQANGNNSASALTSLRAVGAVLPLGIILIAALIYWRYPITSRKHDIILRANARRLKVDRVA